MKRITIDCQTKRTIVEDLTLEEETARLEEIAMSERQAAVRQRAELKRQLAGELAELREMREERRVFDDGDIVEKQAAVDALRAELASAGR